MVDGSGTISKGPLAASVRNIFNYTMEANIDIKDYIYIIIIHVYIYIYNI